MEQENIKKILTDLYVIDPSLKSKEADLISAIKIMQAKKENGYDKEFSARLRGKLLLEANKSNKNHNRYFIPVLAASSLVLLCFVGIFSFNYFDSLKRPQVAIERVGDHAFGVFSSSGKSMELAQNCAGSELPSPVTS
ncbi:MAG TPA: hypothetical protein PLF16_00195, partial [Candidatus Staskawiczbacteria bacterium]|nr:hypothetical protein [Candidatus Staskawiczbacteria bacterium]